MFGSITYTSRVLPRHHSLFSARHAFGKKSTGYYCMFGTYRQHNRPCASIPVPVWTTPIRFEHTPVLAESEGATTLDLEPERSVREGGRGRGRVSWAPKQI